MINYLPPKIISYQEYIAQLFPEDKRKVKTLTFQVTEDCCLKCTYCYQINKSSHYMTFDVAKIFLDKLFNNFYSNLTHQNTKGFILDFIGGEPLMNIDLIQQICDYYFYKCSLTNDEWLLFTRINICSNGILYFNEKVQSFLEQYKAFLNFTISIDGNKYLHDSCRIDFNNQGSYDRAIKAVHHFRQHFPNNNLETKMTLSPSNIAYTYDAILNLINENYEFILCNCIFEEGWNIEHAQILYQELKKIADYLIDNNLYNKINIRLFNEENFQPMLPEDNNNWCGGTDEVMIAIDYQGNLFHCIRFMASSLNNEQVPYILGNIYDGFGSTPIEQERINQCESVTRKSQSTEECFNCPIARGCAWCSGYNYQKTGSVNKRVTYICIMHKATSLVNVYYWNKLYNKLNINKVFHRNLSNEDTLKIINKDELSLLNNLENINKERI